MTWLRRTIAPVLLALGLAIGAWAAAADTAAAHNVLRSTSPGEGQQVDAVPAVVELVFDEPAIALGTQLVITGPNGPVQQGAPRLVDDTVSQAIAPGAPAGAYEVRWRVTSADGHPISGTFTFTAAAAGSGSPAPTTSTAAPSTAPTDDVGPAAPQSPIPLWAWLVTAAVSAIALGSIGYHVWQRRRS